MLSTNKNFEFEPMDIDFVKSIVNLRIGETKIGESIRINTNDENTKYVILGIEESIGPQANFGFSGSENAFKAFLPRFLNMQDNGTLNPESISLIGVINCRNPHTDENSSRAKVEELDNLVVKVLLPYIKLNYIPIVIGGGHNNAFPIIKSASIAYSQAIQVINLDPHADCRPLEGRHSGNPFSYAKSHTYLGHYTVLGLHKAYNSRFILEYLKEHNFSSTFFESYIDEPELFYIDLKSHSQRLSQFEKIGLELDMDSVAMMPSSAFTPSGFRLEEARAYTRTMARELNCIYFHLPEGAPKTEREEKIVGKALALLVFDFISSKKVN